MKVIAELGSNWKTFDDCKNAIHLAHVIGADAIKYQLYSHEELYGYPGDMPGVLPRDWIPRLADKADAVGIEFMCTSFSVDGLQYINPYIKTHKLASSEMCHIDMLVELVKINKPTLVSTGAQTRPDIESCAKVLSGLKAMFMYCEAAYPPKYTDLRKMRELSKLINAPVGYSDHTTDIYSIPLLARDMGAVVLEKHFNPFNYTDTPDAPHSLSTDDFRAMIAALNDDDAPMVGPSKDELPMLLRHKRRVVATQYIAEGADLVKDGNYGIYRCKQDDPWGAHPAMAVKMNGMKLKVPKREGDPIGPKDV